MSGDIISTLGSVGTYTFSGPFATSLPVGENYTCQGIRSVTELLASGVDVLNKYYIPNGLTQSDFDTAITKNTYIISLQCATGLWVYIPANYITAPPSVNGIPYHVMALGVTLGPIKVSSDLSAIKTAISNVIMDNYGITPEVNEIQISKVKIVSNANDVIIQNARNAIILNRQTDTAKLLAMTQNYNNALLKIADLEGYIIGKKTILGI